MFRILNKINAAIINSWNEFWAEYTPDDYKIGVQSWDKSY